MATVVFTYRSRLANAIFDVLNPIPYGMFVGALVFDIVYATTRNVFWGKASAWLITIGLLIAIIPRFINLFHVWMPGRLRVARVERTDFILNLIGYCAAIFNAFVHSRDAYAMVPENVVFSAITVALLTLAHIALAYGRPRLSNVPTGDQP